MLRDSSSVRRVGRALRASPGKLVRSLRRLYFLSMRDLIRGRRAFRVGKFVMNVPDDMEWAFSTGTYYEKNVEHWLREALKILPAPVVYDVGANYGYFTLIAAERARRVVAFEPAASVYSVLQQNVARNELTNVDLFPLALGAESGTRRLTLYSSSGNNSFALPPDIWTHLTIEGFDDVSVRTLDEMIPEEGLPAPDILKIDVEGAEWDVLLGSRRTLETSRPLIILEYVHEVADNAGYSLPLLKEKLGAQQYVLRWLVDPLLVAGDRRLRRLGDGVDDSAIGAVLAIPEQTVWEERLLP